MLGWLSERARPEPQQSPDLLVAFKLKFDASFNALDREMPGLSNAPFGIGHIAIGAVLGYADFRYAKENWREGRSALAAWHTAFASRPSYKATEHADIY